MDTTTGRWTLGRARASVLIGTAGLALAAAVILTPAVTALAAPPTPGPTAETQTATPEGTRPAILRLERLFRIEQRALEREGNYLDRANERLPKLAERITAAKENGKDTSALEEGLSQFKSTLAEAQTEYDAAKQVVTGHAGFDAEGKVTDAQQARETVREAGQAERKVARIARKAIRDLAQAIREFVLDNRA